MNWAFNWPWNIRVTPGSSHYGDARNFLPPDWYAVEVRIGGKWCDAGAGKTWLEAFLMGLVA